MSSRLDYIIINDMSYCVSEDKLKIGDMFINTRNYCHAKVEAIINNNAVIYACICGQCDINDRIIPLFYCKKLVVVDPRLN